MVQLEDSVARLESGDLTLEGSLEVFEKGIAASRACALQLKQTRKRVRALVHKHGGELDLEFLDENDSFEDGSFEGQDLAADDAAVG